MTVMMETMATMETMTMTTKIESILMASFYFDIGGTEGPPEQLQNVEAGGGAEPSQ